MGAATLAVKLKDQGVTELHYLRVHYNIYFMTYFPRLCFTMVSGVL